MKLSALKKLHIFTNAFILTSCGYHAPGALHKDGPVALSIPIIPEDDEGILRSSLARLISSTPSFHYQASNSRFQLNVVIEKDQSESIGYTWDQDSVTGKIENRLYPSEGRRTVKARVSIYDSEKKEDFISPFTIETSGDYDFVNPTAIKNIEFRDLEGEKRSVLQYSLGQLDSEEGAKIESIHPIFTELAKKIVRALNNL